MSEREYLNFDLLLESGRHGDYQARVLSAPTGETAAVPITIPFSQDGLESFLLRIGRPRRATTRSLSSPEAGAVREFGSRLYDAVFHDELRVALAASLDQAEGRGVGLRVRLRLVECPALADLPWEYLYYQDGHRFLALSEWTPLVRYLDLPQRVRPLAVRPPVRVLVMVASPTDFPALDVEAEWAKVREALRGLQLAGRVQLDRVADGSMSQLQRQLRRGEYHVFHYIGHGGYDADAGDGMLVLEGARGRGELVSGSDVGTLLHDHRTLRLAVLNSCEGARSGPTDPYSGTAQSLVRHGIPAVVAMQFEITDEAAITFSRNLYEAVADGYPLDAAVAEARKAVKHESNPVEWGTPVLYMRAPDGRIFDIDTTSGPAGAPFAGIAAAQPVAPADRAHRLHEDPEYSRALAAFFTRQWGDAVDLLSRTLVRFPGHPQVIDRLEAARREQALAQWDAAARDAAEQGRWADAVAALESIVAARGDDDAEAVRRLHHARERRAIHQLQEDLRDLHAAGQWAAVVAVGEQLAGLDPGAADPDGLVSAARHELAELEISARYDMALRQADCGEWVAARDAFAALQRERPGYRDVAALLNHADAQVGYTSGRQAERSGRWHEAIAYYQAALETDPGHQEAQARLRMCTERQAGRLAGASEPAAAHRRSRLPTTGPPDAPLAQTRARRGAPADGGATSSGSRRWIVVPAGAVATTALVVLGAFWWSRPTALDGPAVTTVNVPGTQALVDTGVVCRNGEVLDITATGAVRHDGSSASEVGPDGNPNPALRAFNVAELPHANHAALVGRLDGKSPLFVVGRALRFTCPNAGVLFLGVNDAGVDNNAGKFVVTIRNGGA